VIAEYYALKSDEIKKGYQVEVNFAKQSVMVDGALLTGKIDKVIEGEEQCWTVVDLKTGKGFSDWDESGQSVYDEIKLHHYRYQLMMYKILVENSRDYHTHTVEKGVLEFVEEQMNNKILELSLSFDTQEMKDELERFKKLVVTVYSKITTLDFPDTSSYEESLDGIKEFEEDLIAGRI
jgi:hypothetical protein